MRLFKQNSILSKQMNMLCQQMRSQSQKNWFHKPVNNIDLIKKTKKGLLSNFCSVQCSARGTQSALHMWNKLNQHTSREQPDNRQREGKNGSCCYWRPHCFPRLIQSQTTLSVGKGYSLVQFVQNKYTITDNSQHSFTSACQAHSRWLDKQRSACGLF